MDREYRERYGSRLDREMEPLVFSHAGAKVLVFPTRCGRFHEYEDMGLVGALSHKIEQGQLQLYCVDSADNDSCFPDHFRRLDIVLAVGDQDPFLDDNRQLSESLWRKGVWHVLHVWQGRAHSPKYWRKYGGASCMCEVARLGRT